MKLTNKKRIKETNLSLATKFPKIAKEWDYIKNGDLSPEEITPGANFKVWWKCSKGHSYQAWLNDRTGKRKTGCPKCSYLAKAKKVMCIETGEIFESSKLAAESVNKKSVSISHCAKNASSTCGGYHWKYVE
jgi:hypothetical protein